MRGRVKLMRILLALLMLLSLAVHADLPPPLVLQSNDSRVSLAGHMGRYEDKAQTLTLEQAPGVSYTPVTAFQSRGYTPDVHWYRFSVVRASNTGATWMLVLAQPYLDDVKVWSRTPGGEFMAYQFGDHASHALRPVVSRMMAISLQPGTNAATEFFVRVQSISAMNFSAHVWSPHAFSENESRTNLFNGMYFGILAIIILINLLMGLWLKDFVMLSYAGNVLSLLMLYLGLNDYPGLLFNEKPVWLNDAVVGAGSVGGVLAVTVMWITILDLRREMPRLYRVYLGISIALALLLPFVTTSYYRFIVPAAFQLGMALTVFSLVLLFQRWYRLRKVEHLLYFCAFSGATVGSAIQVMLAMGWLPNNDILASFYQFSTLGHVLLMSLGIALRMRQIHAQKIMAEHEVERSAARAADQRRFVAMLSHEFRNPLAAIDRSSELILLKVPELPVSEARRIASIRENAARLSTMVDSFLATEALDHGAIAVVRENCELAPLLQEVICNLKEATPGRVNLDVVPADARFMMDGRMMAMAVGNLLGNALRYSEQSTPVQLNVMVERGLMSIVIRDHGTGISEAELANLGTPYYRAGSSVGKSGTGLGFYFCHRVIQAHGGKLEAGNHPEGGLEVKIELLNT